jgi:hypothetical protein
MSVQIDGPDPFSVDHHFSSRCGRLRESRARQTTSSKRKSGKRAGSMVEKFSTVCRHGHFLPSTMFSGTPGWHSMPVMSMDPGEARSIIAQLSAIGYFAKISSTRLNASSAATCGATSFFMISAQAACHTCSFWTWA